MKPLDHVSLSGSRRQFLVTSGQAVAATALAGALAQPRPGYAAEKNLIKIALVGCGGRGTGAAANALSTAGPTELWAMADVFPRRVTDSLTALKEKYPQQVNVTPERRFSGSTLFVRRSMRWTAGTWCLLATPAAFRPAHFEYAVEKGSPCVHGEIVRGRCPGHPARPARGHPGGGERPQSGQWPDVAPRPGSRGSRSGAFTTARSAR